MRIIEITYMFWEKFFVITEDNQCSMVYYPMHQPADIRKLKVANEW